MTAQRCSSSPFSYSSSSRTSSVISLRSSGRKTNQVRGKQSSCWKIAAVSSGDDATTNTMTRRNCVLLSAVSALVMSAPSMRPYAAYAAYEEGVESKDELYGKQTYMEGIKGKDYGKSEVLYSDFVKTRSGIQYKVVREGQKDGLVYKDSSKIAVIDWDGYTLGYYGRPFEARNGPKGGAFEEDKAFFRFRADDEDVLPAFREVIMGMTVGSIRRIIVPPNSGLAYPENRSWKKMKPQPNNFSGERALGFVLENQGMIDKTLLFDIELMDVKN